jgi:hypothetical protein
MPTCVEGHTSKATDYCDVCGAPIGSDAAQPDPSPPVESKACPSCGMPVSARFCVACGHDSALPEPSAAPSAAKTTVGWTAVVTADRALYQRVLTQKGPETVEFPLYFPERRIVIEGDTALIGRGNRKQGVDPEIDLGIHPADRGVSSQHAVLRLHGSVLTITDLGSTNGTYLNGDNRLAEGEETPLANGDRIHIGAWTTINIVRD